MRKVLDVHMQEVVRGASIVFTLKMIGAGLAFGFNVLLARMLGAEGAGIYFLALTIITIATVFGRMGLDITLMRFNAAGAVVRDWAAVKGSYRKGMVISLVASGGATLVVFTAAPLLANVAFSKPELTEPLRWMTLAIIPFALLTLQSYALQGLKHMLYSQLVQSVGIPAFSLLGLYLLARTWGVEGAVWAYTIAAALTMLLGFWLWRVATPQLRKVSGRFETRRLVRSSMPLLWVASMNLVILWIGNLALGIWGTNADVGVFGVASRTVLLMSFILIAINGIVAPKFGELYAQGNHRALGALTCNAARLGALLAAPILLLFVVAPEWVLGFFGPGFKGGAIVLTILAIGEFINVATGSVGYLLIMSGYEKLVRNNVVVAAILIAALNVILTPQYGIIGAASATAIGLAAMNLISVALVYWKLSIVTLPIPRRLFGNEKPPDLPVDK